jgi:NTP pyrophosphatase (non-canonical NTP hydrolase)
MKAAPNEDDVSICKYCTREIKNPELPTMVIMDGVVHPSCHALEVATHRDTWQADVKAFHVKMSIPTGLGYPQIPHTNRMLLRGRLHREEYGELSKGMKDNDVVEIADGIADLIYVLLGTAIELGIDMSPIWNEVQKTNMAKEGGGARPDGKILKPPGWEPPHIGAILHQQGW